MEKQYYLTERNQNYILTSEMDSFMNRDKSRVSLQESNQASSVYGNSGSKYSRSQSKYNHNQQLQELLQSETVNYGNMSHLSTEKKRLFNNDMSFFSKDCTQDLSNEEGYNELVGKIHFQRSRNRELVHQLAQEKEKLIRKYLKDIMAEFKQLSDENKRLREMYKKQAGGGFKHKTLTRNQSAKQEEISKNSELLSEKQYPAQTPRNSIKNTRKSIATMSVAGSEQPQSQYVGRQNMGKDRVFFGVGSQNFCHTQKLQTLRPSAKMHTCESSIIITQNNMMPSLLPSPRVHKRRQSQLTERKDYPLANKEGYPDDDFLMMMDENDGEMSFEGGRMSQPGRGMMKKSTQREAEYEQNYNSTKYGDDNRATRRVLNESIERASFKLSFNQANSQPLPAPTNSKNIFIEFLQTLLVQQHLTSSQLTENIAQTINAQQQTILIPSYHNIRYIEQLEREISTKNIKLRQLQEVINVYKKEIQQIVGTDVKMVNELMMELLEVKGKYLEMQQKVDGIARLRSEVDAKERAKENIVAKMKEKAQKNKLQTQGKENPLQSVEAFPIPQSMQTLFELLNIKLPHNPKPIEYLNKIRQLPKNADLFQAFDAKKRSSCNMKIKEVIDQIKEGRKKFNEVIKIYEGRIVKLQEKIQRFKVERQHD